MAEFQELTSILKDLLTNRFAPKPNFVRGLLGDGLGNVKVSGKGKEDKSFVRFNRSSSETFEIFNKEVNPVDNWPVLIGELPGQPGLVQVVGTDWAVYEQTSWGESVGGLDKHAPTHEWPEGSPGSDPLNVYLRSIAPLKSFSLGSGSTQVFVSSFNYEYISTGTVWPGVPGIELGQGASTTPATGTQRMMGIYHNPQLNQLFGVTGSTIPFTLALEPPRPAFPAGINPSSWIRLYGGQNTIAESDIFDARRLFGGYPPTGPAFGDLTGSYPNPQVQGIIGFPIEGDLSDNDTLVFSGSSWQPSPQGGGADATGWPFANIKTLSLTDIDADFNDIYSAIAGISSGQELKIDPGLYILTGTASFNTANTTFYSDDPANTIFSGTIGSHLFRVNADDVVLDGLTMSLTSNQNFASIISSAFDSLQIKNCNMLKLGTITSGFAFSVGLWSIGGENWQVDNTTITANDAIGTGTHVAYNADSAISSAKITNGSLSGDTTDIRLNNANATAELNDPVLENDTLMVMLGSVTGKYISSTGQTIHLDPVSEAINLLYHSLTYDIWPDATSYTALADDSYVAGLWNVLHSGGAAPDITQETPASGDQFEAGLKFDFNASYRGGIVQFLQAADSYPLRGETVSISFDAKGSNVTEIRAAVLSWTSTADTITSDVVGTWGAKPTLATNWGYAGGGDSDITITSSWARYEENEISIPAGANNLAVFIWTPNTEVNTDTFSIARVQLNIGKFAADFTPKDKPLEDLEVSRFFEFFTFNATNQVVSFGIASSTTAALFLFNFRRKRSVPTIALSAASTTWVISNSVAAFTITGISAVAIVDDRASINCTGASPALTALHAHFLVRSASNPATIAVSSRL